MMRRPVQVIVFALLAVGAFYAMMAVSVRLSGSLMP